VPSPADLIVRVVLLPPALGRAHNERIEDEPEQSALFDIEGPDEDDCVWLRNEGQRCFNLGPRDAVAEKMCQWLSTIDYGECH
jgi:hypothetical protein